MEVEFEGRVRGVQRHYEEELEEMKGKLVKSRYQSNLAKEQS
jgi:hypothetical protein